MNKGEFARPYAKAIFEIANQNQTFEKWSTQLKILSLITKDEKIKQVLKNKTIPKAEIVKLYLEITQSLVDKDAENFIRILVDKKRLTILPEIATFYEDLLDEKEQRLRVEISTAKEISENSIQTFLASLEKRFSKKIKVQQVVDNNLIGGFIARMGDIVIDNSLRGQLERLTETLSR